MIKYRDKTHTKEDIDKLRFWVYIKPDAPYNLAIIRDTLLNKAVDGYITNKRIYLSVSKYYMMTFNEDCKDITDEIISLCEPYRDNLTTLQLNHWLNLHPEILI